MRKLIVVRHGQYDDSGHLNNNGRERIKIFARKLQKYIGSDMSVSILASPTYRTYETAEILSDFFDVEFKTHDALLSDGMNHPMNLSEAYKLVKSMNKVDVLILVTHFDYVADLPKYFSEKEWGIKLPSTEIGKGEAWVVDCEQKTLILVN